MSWWLWLSLGLLLLVAEILTPGGFYLLFFGVGALLVGMLSGLGWIGLQWMEWFLFSILSIGALALFRRPLLNRFQVGIHGNGIDSLLGETATALETIPVGTIGKVELRGAAWSARNVGETPIQKGEHCRVEKVEGLMLSIRR